MILDCELKHPLNRDGTHQYERLLEELMPAYARIDERSMRELVRFAVDYAPLVTFYDDNNQVDGNWRDFFPPLLHRYALSDTDEEWETWLAGIDGSLEPHHASFFGFLELFRYAQQHINTLTQRHLDLYFREILNLGTQGPQADQAFLLLELAQTVSRHQLEAGTLFEAGKDASGKTRYYEALRETILNQGRLAEMRTVFVQNRRGFGEHFYASPIANSKDGAGSAFDGQSKWRLFGEQQRFTSPEKRSMQETRIGWAFAAPIMALSEGEREIQLTVLLGGVDQVAIEDYDQFAGVDFAPFFHLSLTGASGWIVPEYHINLVYPDPSHLAFSIQVVMDKGVDPVIGKDASLHGPELETDMPVLRLSLNPEVPFIPYRELSKGVVESFEVTVSATGILNLDLRSDESEFNPGRPFAPFGGTPVIGSRFYAGHPETLSKPLSQLSLQLEWEDLPGNLGDYYAGYEPVSTADFQITADLLWDRDWLELRDGITPFGVANQDLELIGPSNISFNPPANFNRYPEARDVELLTDKGYGYLRINLSGPDLPGLEAFGHKQYQNLYTRRLIEYSQHLSNNNTNPPPVIPNQPFVPRIRQVSLSYTATDLIEPGSGFRSESANLFYLHPFGYLPQALNSREPALFPDYPNEGHLYLGLEALQPPQNITMLFRLAEGSGDNSQDPEESGLAWHYLSGDHWMPFNQLQLFFDSTQGLLQTGILEIAVPQDADTSHRIMPSDRFWIRATVSQNSAAYPLALELNTQAIEVRFQDQNNDPGHLDAPLPGGTNVRLSPGQSQVRSVAMPYASYGGYPGEQELAYYTRIHERLRHKNRAVTLWDYERMVLEAYPEIYKVKCIPHTSDRSEQAPGSVSVIVVPNLRNQNAVDPLRPRVGQGKLKTIHDWLTDHLPSLFVDLVVENPDFEEIQLEFSVGFHPGFDAGFYAGELNEALIRFLTPWAFEEGEDIVFGGRIHKSKIIKFIEDQPYVDFVIDFKVYHNTTGSRFGGIGWMEIECNFIVSPPDVQTVVASSERSVLISADRHQIKVLKPGEHDCETAGKCS